MEGVDLNIQSEGGHINKGYTNSTIVFTLQALSACSFLLAFLSVLGSLFSEMTLSTLVTSCNWSSLFTLRLQFHWWLSTLNMINYHSFLPQRVGKVGLKSIFPCNPRVCRHVHTVRASTFVCNLPTGWILNLYAQIAMAVITCKQAYLFGESWKVFTFTHPILSW